MQFEININALQGFHAGPDDHEPEEDAHMAFTRDQVIGDQVGFEEIHERAQFDDDDFQVATGQVSIDGTADEAKEEEQKWNDQSSTPKNRLAFDDAAADNDEQDK